jgi:hypothetical protein
VTQCVGTLFGAVNHLYSVIYRNIYSGIGLPTTDAEGVIPLSDDRIAILGHHAQITRLQIEVNLLRSAGLEMNALKSAKSTRGAPFSSGNLR